MGFALALALGFAMIYVADDSSRDAVRALAIGFLSLVGALLGIVLTAMAVVAAFFSPSYTARLDERGSLRSALFIFRWVATLAVASITASVALLFFTYVTSNPLVEATLATLAVFLFFASLFETLSVVGNVMRHALYSAALHQPDKK